MKDKDKEVVGAFISPALARLIDKLKPEYSDEFRRCLCDVCFGRSVGSVNTDSELLEVIVSELIDSAERSRENIERIRKVRSDAGKKGAEKTNRMKEKEERQKSAKVGNERQTSATSGKNDNKYKDKNKDKDENEYKDERELINYNEDNSPKGEVTSLCSEQRKIYHYDNPNKRFNYGEISFRNRDVEQVAIDFLPIAPSIKGFPFFYNSWFAIKSTHEMYMHKCKAARMKHILSESGFSVADYVVYLGNVAPNFDLEWSQITSVNYINGFISRQFGH